MRVVDPDSEKIVYKENIMQFFLMPGFIDYIKPHEEDNRKSLINMSDDEEEDHLVDNAIGFDLIGMDAPTRKSTLAKKKANLIATDVSSWRQKLQYVLYSPVYNGLSATINVLSLFQYIFAEYITTSPDAF